jgi:glucose-6-phosphate 1-dehydrogenase
MKRSLSYSSSQERRVCGNASTAPIDRKNLVRGQFRGYKSELGVAPGSQTETFAALKLEVNSWRWQGVTFFIRAGKQLPVTCTEILVRAAAPAECL